MTIDLDRLYARLSAMYDVDDWWFHESPFEIMVGAILTQQTVWSSVAKVLGRMREERLLEIDALADCEPGRLQEVVRPAGFYRQKSERLIEMARYLRDQRGGDMAFLRTDDLHKVRAELMSLKGIGDETADAILLFAGNRPKFVAAAYTVRVLDRVGTLPSCTYRSVQHLVESHWSGDAQLYRELYADCVQHCKTVCLTDPWCSGCRLNDVCDHFLRKG